ncbi:MAG TPA: hypothetical protein VGO00_24755 [Kofleriaceae bacterium]|nr:hypothetical protein [Kofleriaceae bacterium]
MLRSLAVAAAVVVAAAAPASADVFKLFAEADGGAVAGKGTSGDAKDNAFFANAKHPMYGVLVGAELLIFDAWIQHQQFTNGSELSTWTQFGLGIHNSIDLGDEKQRAAHKGPFFDIASGAWFGLGTGQQIMPPLDNAQVTDKGFLVEARLGLGTHLSKNFDFGVALPVSWGYFIKNGGGTTVNDTSSHYQSVQGELMLFLRVNIGLL